MKDIQKIALIVSVIALLCHLLAAPVPAKADTSFSFGYTGTLQTFTVPTTGVYSITAYGAQGGNAVCYGCTVGPFPGGLGAVIRGDVTLTEGETLTILVGGAAAAAQDSGGGGGGTFVALANSSLVVAGGGGGSGLSAGGGGSGPSAGGGGGGGAQYTGGGGGGGYNGAAMAASPPAAVAEAHS